MFLDATSNLESETYKPVLFIGTKLDDNERITYVFICEVTKTSEEDVRNLVKTTIGYDDQNNPMITEVFVVA
jgi:hypothetical protein